MKPLLRRLAKRFVESENLVVPAIVRQMLFVRQCRRDAKLTDKVATDLGLRPLKVSKSGVLPTPPTTLFILAGGASVNELSSKNFNEIRKGVSVGINFWPIHDFVPDILTTETDNETPASSFLNERLSSHTVLRRPPTILILRTSWPPKRNALPTLPREYEGRTWVYGRANLITRKEANLQGDLSRVLQLLKRKRLPATILPDNGSSVVRLTFWGIAQQFKRIVWVGVDQDSGHYFWTEPPVPARYRQASKIAPRIAGSPHSTSSSDHRPFSNDVFLRALAKSAEALTGSRIYVGSKRSSLSDSLPVFEWQ